jgi:hypothetical protein
MGILREPIRKPLKQHAYKSNRKRFVTATTARGECIQLEPKFTLGNLWPSLQQWGKAGCPELLDPKLIADRDVRGRVPNALVQPTTIPIDEQLRADLRALNVSNAEPWYQFVQWISGQQAAENWLAAMQKFSSTNEVPSWVEDARQLHRHLTHLHRECKQQRLRFFADRFYGIWPRTYELLQNAAGHVTTLVGQLCWPERPGIRAWLSKTIALVQSPIAEHDEYRNVYVPTTFATWFASDSCWQLEPAVLHRWLATEEHWTIRYFWELMDRSSAKERRRLLHRQNYLLETKACAWRAIARADRTPKRSASLSAPQYFERIHSNTQLELELLKATGISWCLQYSRDRNHIYRPWLSWLQQWPQKTVHSQMSNQWNTILKQLGVLIELRPELSGAWNAWLHSTRQEATRPATISDAPTELDPIARTEFAKLLVYRRILGFRSVIPKSCLNSALDPLKRKRELDHLSEQYAKGAISHKAALRLAYLQNQSNTKLPRSTSIRRHLSEASFNASLHAVRKWIGYREQQTLRRLNLAWAETLKPREQLELLQFLASLEKTTREMLVQALQAWADSSTGHRDFGSRNRYWIDFATEKGLKWEHWIASDKVEINCPVAFDNDKATKYKRLTIQLSNDPRHVLWMGRPFDSCLDLVDGAYAASVVPNWMDANKQLLVAMDEYGNMLARRLLAITDKMELLTYRIYSSIEEQTQETPGPLHLAMDAYCDHIASMTGTVRASEGKPRRLHSTRWYNDGPVAILPNSSPSD